MYTEMIQIARQALTEARPGIRAVASAIADKKVDLTQAALRFEEEAQSLSKELEEVVTEVKLTFGVTAPEVDLHDLVVEG